MNATRMLAGMSCAALVCGAALAVPIHPGEVVNLSGTTLVEEPWHGGPSISGANILPFTITDGGGSPVFQGTFTSEPSRSDIMGTVRVRYSVRDMQAIGDRRVVRFEMLGFAGFQTNVEFRTDGSGDIGPSLASRTNGDGAQITFIYANPLFTPNLDSRFCHVFTNATTFAENGLVRIVLNTGESVILAGIHIPAFTDCPGDTNGDGIVNFTDLNTVLSNFGDDCN